MSLVIYNKFIVMEFNSGTGNGCLGECYKSYSECYTEM